MPRLTEPQKRALRILYEHGPLHPREFARFMWPDSPGWKVHHNCGYGVSAGSMMAMAGGGYLGKLHHRGWVAPKYHWNRHGELWLDGHVLTDVGRELAKGLQNAKIDRTAEASPADSA